MGTSSKGIYKIYTIKSKRKKDKSGKQTEIVFYHNTRTQRTEPKIISRNPKGKTLTHKDMYDKNGKSILPYGGLPKKYRNRSKYDPPKL